MSAFDVSRIHDLGAAIPRDLNARTSSGAPCGACPVRGLTFCAPLEERELAEVARIVKHLTIPAGQPLFDEGEPARHVFSVTEGAMKVYKLLPDGRRQVTGFLFSGDFLGLAHNESYAYSAEAMVGTSLCRFGRSELEGLLERFPQMERRLLHMASHELAVAQDQMLLLGRKTAKEKIASFLLMLSRRQELRGQSANPIALPMSRTDIGDYLGLTTETVSRTFTQLKTAGEIALLSGNRVEVADSGGLARLAEGEGL